MEPNRFSTNLSNHSGEVSNVLLSNTLSDLGVIREEILVWDENRIAVTLDVSIDLPPLGNFQGVDIRATEPIILVFDLKEYPTEPPKVFPDRLDFPKDSLAHLYVAVNGKPPGFCLVREGLKEWYSNKSIKDLIIRIANWLRDAAAGELATDGNEFDPLRLENYTGTFIYDYNKVVDIVKGNKSYIPGSNFAMAFFETTFEGSIALTLQRVVNKENQGEILTAFLKEKAKDRSTPATKRFNFGYVLWSLTDETFNNYDVILPRDLMTFRAYCNKYNIDFSQLEKFIAEEDWNDTVILPLILAIKRPKNLIGYSSNVEFINFTLRIDTPDVKEGVIINNVPIDFHSHNQPLTLEKALKVSGSEESSHGGNLIFGCGALGSKIVMHFARGGFVRYFLVDPDTLSSHNLVRHALLSNHVGMMKARAMEQAIKQIYAHENAPVFNANVLQKEFMQEEVLSGFSYVFDFTASNSFFQRLVNLKKVKSSIISGFISSFGRIGILLFEGNDRNPRIDDLKILLYDKYKSHQFISDWLKKEANESSEQSIEVDIGVGCSSETIILSDEAVSLHAAFFAGTIKRELKTGRERGKIFLSRVSLEDFFGVTTDHLEIEPLTILTPENDPSWEVRIKNGIVNDLKSQMGLAMPYETGGVLIGRVNYKTRTIHVTDIILAPPDSKSNHVCFFRGIEGLSDQVGSISEASGGQFGYIGEWHTHPFGPDEVSDTDHMTMMKFKDEFELLHYRLPVFLLIVTPVAVIVYVY